jgi:integrase
VKKRSDGRLVKKITDPKTKKPVYIYGKTMAEINRKILSYKTKEEQGRTFKDVADEWWAIKYDEYAAQTLRGVAPAYKRIVEMFGDFIIAEITPRHISMFFVDLANMGMTKKTISNHKSILNQIFDEAVVNGDIKFNPCLSVKVTKGASSQKRDSATTSEEEKILQSADVWIFPFIALCTGMRKGEILALQWKDIDFDSEIISVTKSIYHVGHKAYVKPPKTESGIRTVPLVNRLKSVLLQSKGADDEYVVSGKEPLQEYQFEKKYRDFQRITGVKATAHQIRHSFATLANEAGVEGKSAQEVLGHAQLSTTMDIYTDFRKKSLDKVKVQLNSIFD